MIPKFRAYVKNGDRYLKIDNDRWAFIFNDYNNEVKVHDHMVVLITNKENIVLSTGLKDKNGVEIYEGDILKTSIKNLVVEWVPKGACWGIGCHYLFHYYETSEVIGNKYQHPELLERGNSEEI